MSYHETVSLKKGSRGVAIAEREKDIFVVIIDATPQRKRRPIFSNCKYQEKKGNRGYRTSNRWPTQLLRYVQHCVK